MKQEVLRDFGVTIAGKNYPHGSVVDSDKLAPDADASGLPAHLTDEERKAEVQKRQDELNKQAQTDYAAANEAGYFGPHVEAPANESRRAARAKGQEG